MSRFAVYPFTSRCNSALLLWLALATVVPLAATACCPIPVPRMAMLRPEAHVQVVDAAGGQALEGATVVMQRYEAAPHRTMVARWPRASDGDGKVEFPSGREREWIMPLMMHGVPFYGWRICVMHDGYETLVVPSDGFWHESDGQYWELTAPLTAGISRPCEEVDPW